MQPTATLDKLRILLPHWIAHNRDHGAEFRKWADAARADGAERLASRLDEAAASMAVADEILQAAQSEAGLPAGGSAPAHTHAHHHEHAHDHRHE